MKENVFYIPKLGTNLFSIGAATSQGVKATFTNDEVHFYKDGKLQLVGKRTKNTLYCLNISIDMEETDVAMAEKHTCPLSTWHERFAHTSNNTILKMSTLGLTDGLNLKNSSPAHSLCVGCKLGKMTRLPFPIGRLRATRIGSLIHSDVCGAMEHPSPSGARYFVTFKDDHSGWCSVHFMKNKDEVPMLFLNFAASVKTQTGNNVIVLRSDNGGEYTGKEFRNKLLQLGISHETSAPYTPAQNGVAERSNWTILNAARSVIYSSRVPIRLWAEAIAYSVYTLNRVLSSTAEITPYESWYKKRPDVSHLRIFGSRTFVHIPESLRKKLDPKSREGIFVGYCETSKAFRVWIPNMQKVVISRDVFIDETNTNFPDTDASVSETLWFPPYETQAA
jgi:hypothetical protein